MKSLKMLLLIVILTLAVPTIMAADWDNWDFTQEQTFDGKQLNENPLWEKYPPLKVDNLFGLGRTFMEGYLETHDEVCGKDCDSTVMIKMYEKGALVQDVRFIDMHSHDQELVDIDYTIQVYGLVDEYQTVCPPTGYTFPNGTVELDWAGCEYKVTGQIPGWETYTLGTEVDAGVYEVKITGKKARSQAIDWQFRSGFGPWLTSLATWGNISGGDDAQITLENPADGATISENPQIFNGTANITGGSTLVNVSFWHNYTGTFALNQSYVFSTDTNWTHGCDDLNNSYSDIGGANWRAQTITPDAGTIEYVNATYITQAGSPGTCYVWISSNTADPDSNVLGIGSFDGNSRTSWINITVDISPDVSVDGSQYAIGWNCTDSNLRTSVQSTGTYAGGHIRWSSNSGSSWSDSASAQDIIFRLGMSGVGPTDEQVNFSINVADSILWSMQGCDSDGDCGFATENRTVTFSTPPDVSIIYPTNTTYTINVTNLNYTASDPTADSCWYTTDSGATNSTPQSFATNWSDVISTEGANAWTVWCNDSFGAENSSTISFWKDTVAPDISLSAPTNTTYLTDYATTNSTQITVNWTADATAESCWYIFDNNGSNVTVTCSDNGTIFNSTYMPHGIVLWTNDSLGNLNSSSVDWTNDWKIWQNAVTYNASAWDTKGETYVLNITTNGTAPTSNFIYNGTSYTATRAGSNPYTFTSSFDVPLATAPGNKAFYWNISIGEVIASSSTNQYVNQTIFDQCNATFGTIYLNLTFKDETNDTYINGNIPDFAVDYYLGSGTVNRTLNFVNLTDFSEYDFCLSAQAETVNVDADLHYQSTGYPQRNWLTVTTWTNTTTARELYLLLTAEGLYSTYNVQTADGTPIPSVSITVERQFGGVWTIVEQGTTDAAGSKTFWLSPDYDHRFTFTRTGYTSVQETLRPSSSTYTVIMGAATTSAYNTSLQGIQWWFSPKMGQLLQNTLYNFTMNVTANLSNVDNCRIRLLDEDKSVMLTGTAAGTSGGAVCYVALTNINTSANDSMYGEFSVDTGSGYYIIDTDAYWVLYDEYEPKGGIWEGIFRLRSYDGFGTDERAEFSKAVFFFLIVACILSTLSFATKWDRMSPGGSIMILTAIIWMGSFAGFLYFDITHWGFFDKYILAFSMTLLAVSWIIAEVRKGTT